MGKSSLISTFVSRHFSETVPGIMTRVRLPPDPSTNFTIQKNGTGKKNGGGCVTTIVDTQRGDAGFIDSISPFSSPTFSEHASKTENKQPSTTLKSTGMTSTNLEHVGGTNLDNVDVIVLVYDVDRTDNFYRLEHHWLPLIERYYRGEIPVIIAGNKMDARLSSATDDQAHARSRHQIVSLLQRFNFVRQCIKCSAKTLVNVNDVFVKAQHAVLYPINPLYDLSVGELTSECKMAFTRIFRMFDEDKDGLLNNAELNSFQSHCFKVSIMEGDLAGWKKVLSKNNPVEAVVRDGKFTVFGFLAIFDVFISSDRSEIPWIILRTFGYDNNLRLNIPPSVTEEEFTWPLSFSAKQFLAALFHQFASNVDGSLSPNDILSIFSIIPKPSLPPWHPSRVKDILKGCFSLPKITGKKILEAASKPSSDDDDISTMKASSPDPHIFKMTLYDWIGYWHMISSISPTATRTELYLLGHVGESGCMEVTPNGGNSKVAPLISESIQSFAIRVMVVGSKGCGKTAFLNTLCHREGEEYAADYLLDTYPTKSPETVSMHAQFHDKNGKGSVGKYGKREKKKQG